ncbi:hypothetical protein PFISCL1PPCAC_483, partial [Pristionchus fissidentatus]
MNADPRSVYITPSSLDGYSSPPVIPVRSAPAEPPQPQPRTSVPCPATVPEPRPTVPRPKVTLAALREAKAIGSKATTTATVATTSNHRIPVAQRRKEAPAVPARERLKKKTVAFGVTVNVSQTVERAKETDPTVPSAPTASSKPMVATRQGAGLAPTRALAGGQDENRDPREETAATGEDQMGMKDVMESLTRLSARVVELEQREEESRRRETEMSKQFEKLVKVVAVCNRRIDDLEGGGGDERRGRSPVRRRETRSDDEEEEEEDPRARRRLYETVESGG